MFSVRRIPMAFKFGCSPFVRLVPACFTTKQNQTIVTESIISSDTLGRWTGGRESLSGIVATVFGASSHVGPHVVARLARIGSHVIIPYRDDGMDVRELKCMGALGKVNLLPLDMADEESVRRLVAKSNVVINLIGSDINTRNYSIRDTNVNCTYQIAKCAAETGLVERFIQVSAEGADLNSDSEFLSSKAEAEDVVRHFFPNVTIVRPNTIFGMFDKFLNRLALLGNYTPIMPTFRGGKQKSRPVWVNDVAQSIINCLYDYRSQGKTYHLFGPDVYTQKEINDFVLKMSRQSGNVSVDISSEKWLNFYAWLMEKLTYTYKYRLLTKDIATRMKYDVLPPEGPDVLTLENLGIEAASMSDKARPQFELHIGERQTSYQEKYGVKRSRLERNPALVHPNYDSQYPVNLHKENINDYDGVMPDGTRLPNAIFDWDAYQKKYGEGLELEKRLVRRNWFS